MIEVQKTEIPDLLLVQPKVFGDERGSFIESFNEKEWAQHGLHFRFVQDNQSISQYGVIRGLHFQRGPYSQTKVLRVARGRILDVVVDLRPDSPTFQRSFAVELNEKNGLQIVIPKNFAHGFAVLSETATVLYKCDQFYSPQHESGIHPLDEKLNIPWPIPKEQMILSDKDKKWPTLQQVVDRKDWELK
jgi:dTDP-4-dehydrorhamnose 3,5-epimerase